jgi:ComF family protein
MNLYDLKRSLISFVYPNRCPFCDKVITAGGFFCENCAELDYFKNDMSSKNTFCCVYNEKSKPFLSKAKENADGYAISAAAKLLHDALVRNNVLHKIDIITAIPARKAAKKQRGYNFPALLAKEIAQLSEKKYSPKMLVLLRETEEQKELSAEARAENLKGAFGARKLFPGLNVLVIDDVCATGATLNEARRTLEERADAVFIAAFAKTI